MENVQLKAEYSLLQESYRELEQTRDLLKDTQATCQSNLTDAQKEADKTKEEVNNCTMIHDVYLSMIFVFYKFLSVAIWYVIVLHQLCKSLLVVLFYFVARGSWLTRVATPNTLVKW
jgi:hypothetical protein